MITVVIGIDSVTIEQLLVSAPTWAKHRPEMWNMPWLFFYDRDSLKHTTVQELASTLRLDKWRAVQWPGRPDTPYSSQREKMLSGFCHIPAECVETLWWMKVDTDVLATRPGDWLRREWFQPKACDFCGSTADSRQTLIKCSRCDGHVGQLNAWVSSPWHYTVGATQPATLDDWGDQVPGLQQYPRLEIPHDPKDRTVRHPRMASWVSFYNTQWSWDCRNYLHETGHIFKLPVPSQDTFHWYVSERRRDRVTRFKMKNVGWTTCSRLQKLKVQAQEIMSHG